MSLTDVFAEPMLDSDSYLQRYKNQLIELDKKGLLPKLDATLTYKVYSIRGSEFGAHKSIVVTADDEHFFTVELGFIKVNGKKHIYQVTRQLHPSNKPKLEYLGTVKAKRQDLIAKAVAVMKQFGNYFKFCKNCQDFCNKYVEAIGLKEAKSLTDGDKAESFWYRGSVTKVVPVLPHRKETESSSQWNLLSLDRCGVWCSSRVIAWPSIVFIVCK